MSNLKRLEELEESNKGYEKLCDEQDAYILSLQADAQVMREALEKNHKHHEVYDDLGGYDESELCEINCKALSTNPGQPLLDKLKELENAFNEERARHNHNLDADGRYIEKQSEEIEQLTTIRDEAEKALKPFADSKALTEFSQCEHAQRVLTLITAYNTQKVDWEAAGKALLPAGVQQQILDAIKSKQQGPK